MRVLYLAHRVPFPPNKGEKIRAFQELRALAARGHLVDVLAFADDPDDLRHHDELRKICASVRLLPLRGMPGRIRVLAAFPFDTSLTVAYFNSDSMHAAVRGAVQSNPPDAVVVFSSSMAQYVPPALRPRTLIDLIDVDSEKWHEYAGRRRFPANLLFALEARRLRAYEHSLVVNFPRIVLTTPREIKLLDSANVHGMQALSTGVDTDYFTPGARDIDAPPEIVFTGVMDYFPNVDAVQWFVQEVWPAIAHVPGIRFTIVGSRPTAAVRALAHPPAITVTGAVPDVRPYLQRASIAVVPLRVARGMQNKMLEAMASGLPVVATAVSVEAFGASEFPVCVASDPRQFADSILSLLGDTQRRAALSKSGRAYVEQHYRWEPILDRFCSLVESASIGSI